VPLFLPPSASERPKTVFTIHNLAFQGLFPAEIIEPLGLPPELFTVDGFEFYD
jgi:starch synthase